MGIELKLNMALPEANTSQLYLEYDSLDLLDFSCNVTNEF